jgi:molybdopterin biosynthesis enzyme MoaB
MRTTIDVPEDLLRRAKAEAALKGMSLKEWMTRAVRAALREPAQVVSEGTSTYTAEEQAVGADCVFPLIRGEGGPALRDLPPERVHEILEKEEADRAGDAADPL